MPELDRLVDAIADLQTLVNRADNEIARELEVGQGHDLQTLRLVSTGGGLKVSDVARRQSVSNATASARIDRLERKGFVARVRSETDRRVVIVRLTDAGRSAARRSIKLRRDVLAEVEDPAAASLAVETIAARYREHLRR